MATSAKRETLREIAGSVTCRCGSSLLAEAVPRWNSRMDSRAPRIQPSVLREDRIAARLARVMYRYRDCHQIERRIIHSKLVGDDAPFIPPIAVMSDEELTASQQSAQRERAAKSAELNFRRTGGSSRNRLAPQEAGARARDLIPAAEALPARRLSATGVCDRTRLGV